MRKWVFVSAAFLACAATGSSKDKSVKVPFQQMALGMRDAFNCGVVVEQYLHGSLKGKPDDYHQRRSQYNCDHVESVLNTLPEDTGNPGTH
jgi:hypothetical protein